MEQRASTPVSYCLVLVPPSPPVLWNHGVRRKILGRSLILKDLR